MFISCIICLPFPKCGYHSSVEVTLMITLLDKLSRLKLTYQNKTLEATYQSTVYQTFIPSIRWMLVIAMVAYTLYATRDPIAVPEASGMIRTIRLLAGIPLMSFVLILSFSKYFARIWQGVLVVLFLAMGLLMSYTALVVGRTVVHSYFGGLILLLVFNYTLSHLPLHYAALTGWSILMLYDVMATLLPMPSNFAHMNHLILLVLSNLIGMTICYQLERLNRHDFETKRHSQDMSRRIQEETLQYDGQIEALRHKIDTLSQTLEQTRQTLYLKEHLASSGTLSGEIMPRLDKNLRAIQTDFSLLLDQFHTLRTIPLDRATQTQNDPSSKETHRLQTAIHARLKHTSSTLKHLAVFTSDSDALDQVPFDLNDILLSTLLVLTPLIKPHGDLQVVLSHDTRLFGYPQKMRLMIYHVLMNATDAIMMNPTHKKGTIRVSTHQTDTHVSLLIKDNGCGMQNETLAHAFDAFYTTKPHAYYNGLGLSIAHEIAFRYHEGSITLESAWHQGTLVNISLPKRPLVDAF